MSNLSATLVGLKFRLADFEQWLSPELRKRLASQKHLDRHSDECLYWHFGYYQAVRDVMHMIERPGLVESNHSYPATDYSPDTAKSFLPAALDGENS